ncbi:non-ribosomal peptide synthetase, partial [Paenibacillus glycinis]
GRVEQALNSLIARHESLRTSFTMADGEVVQIVHPVLPFAVSERQTAEAEAAQVVEAFIRPFDLQVAPLLRTELVQMAPERHLLLLDMHHIIADGVSLGVMVEEFTKLYAGEELPALRIQYKDYAAWQQQRAGSAAMKEHESYWLEALAGEVPTLQLPTDYPRPAVRSFEGAQMDFTLDEALASGLKRLAEETGTTLYMVLLAAYKVLLSKYTGQEEMIVGSPIAGRAHADVERMLGLFVNTLAIRSYPTGEKTFASFLQEVKACTLLAFEHQEYPFEELVGQLELPRDLSRHPLFDTMFILQNTERGVLELPGLCIVPYEQDHHAAKFDLTLQAAERENEIDISMEYSTALFKSETIQRMAAHFRKLLEVVVSKPQAAMKDMGLLSEAERQQILFDFNATTSDYPQDNTIHGLFEAQAERTPDNIAVVFEEQQLTYRELNARSNQLARVLRDKGVQPDSLVGIMAERSLEMIVGIMAILKSGGAYVPIDPEYPEERIRYMLEDSGADLLLTQRHLVKQYDFQGELLCIEEASCIKRDESNLKSGMRSHHLAYVIYTSGTTGKAKGVGIEHKAILNTLEWRKREYAFTESDRAIQLASYSFDSFVSSFFTPILSGASAILLKETHNPAVILEVIEKQKITHLFSVPTLYHAILEQLGHNEGRSLRIVTLGGERVTRQLVEQSRQKLAAVEVINEYGPTENSVITTVIRYGEEPFSHTIGRPISNTNVYVLSADDTFQPLPIGVAGELCVAGAGLARGYLNRPELTAERFVSTPFAPGGRMYRTGDLARWLSDGTIEYLGRIDHQVKIRGYRIELGEVEAQLLQVRHVKETVVIAWENERGDNELSAYVVAEEALTIAQLRGPLSAQLPRYMVPAHFVQLEKMPLTPNGKIDRKALPAPKGQLATGVTYVAPRSELEWILASIWETLLGSERVGRNDNFFELGGDSIKAIQMIARLHARGLKLNMKQLFQNPELGAAARYVQPVEGSISQEPVEGEAWLSPIQYWFFQSNFTDMHHWNQAVMLKGENDLDETILRQVWAELIAHHDALRMVYRQSEQGMTGWNRGVEECLPSLSLTVVDLREESDANLSVKVEVEATRLQSSLHLNDGPLVCLGVFRTSVGDHLLIAIHHLVVDGVSWRILLEDFDSAYAQAMAGEAIRLPEKTTSFQEWTAGLHAYAQRNGFWRERQYWERLEGKQPLLVPKDSEVTTRRQGDSASVTIRLSAADTARLLKEAPRAYRTEINDALLTALGLTLSDWSGDRRAAIHLEGHGREEILDGVDVSRTVGWFTSQYPVVIEMDDALPLGEQLIAVKEQLRSIPNKGMGYGVLRYLSSVEGEDQNKSVLRPEVGFNYLGEFGARSNGAWAVSSLPTGATMSPNSERMHALDINGILVDGQLSFNWTYAAEEYNENTVRKLAETFAEHLRAIATHCAAQPHSEWTPSDYGYNQLSMTEIRELKHMLALQEPGSKIEQIYPLSPMQQGMLFHTLLDISSSAYFVQIKMDFRGELDTASLKTSFQQLAERHDVLRTIFLHEGQSRPLQVVLDKRELPVVIEDLRGMDEAEQNAYVARWEVRDRRLGFDVTHEPLMRLGVLMTEEHAYRIVWSNHHMLMDGWCLPILIQEWKELYRAAKTKTPAMLATPQSYRLLIDWLESRENDEALDYWGRYLAGYDKQMALPQHRAVSVNTYEQEEAELWLGEALTEQLETLAKRQQVTLNTVLQTIWGIMVGKYNSTRDAVFGSVVSGRPPEIANVEKIVGLFINTIPVRVNWEEQDCFEEVLQEVQRHGVEAKRHEYVPLADIQKQSELKQELFNHILVFENYPVADRASTSGEALNEELTIEMVSSFEQTHYDFNVIVVPGKSLRLRFSYNMRKFEKEMVTRMQGHLKQLVETAVNDPRTRVSDMVLLTGEELQQLKTFDIAGSDYPRDRTIHQLFEAQAERTPDNIAVVFEEQQLTYRELNERANQLARVLRDKGVQADSLVGLMVERSLEMIVGIMAILKAGGAYVPIDPEYPADRIQYMLEDSGTTLLVTQSHLQTPSSFTGESLALDDYGREQFDTSNLQAIAAPDSLAYIIYTSGSTGRPKGVMIEHRNVVQLLMNNQLPFTFSAGDVWTMFHSYCFDFSVWELFGALLY